MQCFVFGYNGCGQLVLRDSSRFLPTPTKLDFCTSVDVGSEHDNRQEPAVFERSSVGRGRQSIGLTSQQQQTAKDDASVLLQADIGGTSASEKGHASGSTASSRTTIITNEVPFSSLRLTWNATAVNADGGFVIGCLCGQNRKRVDLSCLDNISPSKDVCLQGDDLFYISESGDAYALELADSSDMKASKVSVSEQNDDGEEEARGKVAAKTDRVTDGKNSTEEKHLVLGEGRNCSPGEVSHHPVHEQNSHHTEFRHISAGDSHVLAIIDPSHQAGSIARSEDGLYVFHRFPHLPGVQQVSCGKGHALLLSEQGSVYSLGMGSRGQLGHGDVGREDRPRLIEAVGSVTMTTVSAGGWHSACISDIGDLYIWGWNESGQLGFPSKSAEMRHRQSSDSDNEASSPSGAVTFQMIPGILDLPGGVNVSKVGCGSRHTVVVTYDKRLYSWGWGKYGQLGHGDTQSLDVPREVDFFRHSGLLVTDVRCGDWSTVVQTSPAPQPMKL